MRQNLFKNLFGGGLIVLGGLMLLEQIGLLRGASSIFWGAVMLMGCAYFMYIFFQSPKYRWWAIIPAMALFGMAGSALLPLFFAHLAGGFFLLALGLAFFIIYLSDRDRWWGIIPGGVLFTLGAVATFEGSGWAENGTLFFLGLGVTFLLVAILPTPAGKMQWAYIPALVLGLIGVGMASQVTTGLGDYVLPFMLIAAGLAVVIGFFFQKDK